MHHLASNCLVSENGLTGLINGACPKLAVKEILLEDNLTTSRSLEHTIRPIPGLEVAVGTLDTGALKVIQRLSVPFCSYPLVHPPL